MTKKQIDYPEGTINISWTRGHTSRVTPRSIAWVGGIATCLYVLLFPGLDIGYKLLALIEKSFYKQNYQYVSSSAVGTYVFIASLLVLASFLAIWIYGLARYLSHRKGWTVSSISFTSTLLAIGVFAAYLYASFAFGFHYHFVF